jgi:ubiquinone/menaquinone biosynthesis C-methylase UbiE
MESNVAMTAVRSALRRDIKKLSFGDNSYNQEAFFAASIADGFAGWYEEGHAERQVDFILRECGVRPGSEVLDAACGHGRHAELLTEHGHRVTGIDTSEALITHLREKTGDRIRFQKMSFSQMTFRDAFDQAIVLGNSLGLIPRAELGSVLGRLRLALRPGGALFIEMDNRPWFVSHEAGHRSWSFHRGCLLMLSQHHYEEAERLEKTIDTSIDLDSNEVTQFCLTKTLYDCGELMELLRHAQLRVEHAFGDWDGHAAAEDSQTLLMAARRSS